jgi:preprotein translocase subunit SecG
MSHVVVGAASPHARDTPTGILIGSQPRIRKGFVINWQNVVRSISMADVWLGHRSDSHGSSVAVGRCCVFQTTRRIPAQNDARSGILRRVETIFSVLEVAFAVILIFLVLMHSGKDSGLSGAFGVGSGTGPLGGGSLVERNLNRWTIFFAVLFFLNAFLLLKAPWA